MTISLTRARLSATAAGVCAFILASMFFTVTTSQGSAAWVCLVLGSCAAVLGHYGFAALSDTVPNVYGRLAIAGGGYGVAVAGLAALF